MKKVQERLEARLIRYADDFVVLSKGNAERVLKGIKTVMNNLELSLNDAKTKTVDARKEDFNFLGFTIGIKRSIRTGREFPLIRPSKKAMKQIKAEIKSLTNRRTLALPTGVVIGRVNEAARGWVGYFRYGNCCKDMSRLKGYIEERVQIYLRHKHRKKGQT
ncbi:MAG: maturase [Nitrospirae bacterium]|nr:maturase [Nitrospirota bacterium]